MIFDDKQGRIVIRKAPVFLCVFVQRHDVRIGLMDVIRGFFVCEYAGHGAYVVASVEQLHDGRYGVFLDFGIIRLQGRSFFVSKLDDCLPCGFAFNRQVSCVYVAVLDRKSTRLNSSH